MHEMVSYLPVRTSYVHEISELFISIVKTYMYIDILLLLLML